MEDKEPTKFVDWMNTLTLANAINILLIAAFTVAIIILVVRTFRNKSSA